MCVEYIYFFLSLSLSLLYTILYIYIYIYKPRVTSLARTTMIVVRTATTLAALTIVLYCDFSLFCLPRIPCDS